MRRVLELFALAALLFFVSAGISDTNISPLFHWTGVTIAFIAEGLLIYKGFKYIIKNYRSMLK